MKRYGNLFAKIVCIENIADAHQNAKKGKSWYKEIKEIDADLDCMLAKIHKEMIAGLYKTSKYHVFERKCGDKLRTIYKLPYYPDRIVHHAILQVLLPILIKNLTSDTYACIPGRGIHKCASKIKIALRSDTEHKYCLKMDITKFYPSIDHGIMKSKLRRLIKCEKTIALIEEIVDSTDNGIPIGNYLSQHLANLYLSSFDHWIKERKRVKHYFRYSDDIVILGKNKAELHALREDISNYLSTHLMLSVKNNWQVFPVASRGIDFLGYRFFPGYTLLRKSIALRFKRSMRMIAEGHKKPKTSVSSYVSYYGWLLHANTLNLRRTHMNEKVISKIAIACEEMGCKNPTSKMVV